MTTRQTSIESYHKIKSNGLLVGLRWFVYDILFHHGPLTGTELIKHVGRVTNTGSLLTRLSELRKMGVVYEVNDHTVCPVTGNIVILWDVTIDIPVPLEPKLTHKQQIAILDREIETLKAENRRLKEFAIPKTAVQGFLGFAMQ